MKLRKSRSQENNLNIGGNAAGDKSDGYNYDNFHVGGEMAAKRGQDEENNQNKPNNNFHRLLLSMTTT